MWWYTVTHGRGRRLNDVSFNHQCSRCHAEFVIIFHRAVKWSRKCILWRELVCLQLITCWYIIYILWRCGPTRTMASSFVRFLHHTQRRITVGRTSLVEWSANRRDLYLTTHSTHNRQTSMPPVGFEPTISAGERPQTYPLDRAATGTGIFKALPL